MQQHRRDTIAFMPQSIEGLKFADDMEDQEADLMPESPLLLYDANVEKRAGEQGNSSSATLTRILARHRGDPNTFIPFLPTLFSRPR